jgi:hypothetical protein
MADLDVALVTVPFCPTESNPTVSSENINPTPPHDLNPIPDRVRRKNVSGFLQTTLSEVPRNYISARDVVGRRGTSDKVLTLIVTNRHWERDFQFPQADVSVLENETVLA